MKKYMFKDLLGRRLTEKHDLEDIRDIYYEVYGKGHWFPLIIDEALKKPKKQVPLRSFLYAFLCNLPGNLEPKVASLIQDLNLISWKMTPYTAYGSEPSFRSLLDFKNRAKTSKLSELTEDDWLEVFFSGEGVSHEA